MRLGISTQIRLFSCAAVAVSVAIVAFLLIDSYSELLEEQQRASLARKVEIESHRLSLALKEIANDVRFLSGTPPIQGIVRAREAGGIDPADGSSDQIWRDRLATIFIEMIRAKPDYEQIRYIGAADDGRELVRVDRRDGAATRVAEAEVQAAETRDYLREALSLTHTRLYFSPINLDREQGRVKEPHTPVLRTAVAVHTPAGRPFGIVIINMNFASLLHEIYGSSHGRFGYFLANQAGDFLLHPDVDRTYGFDLGQRFRVQDDFPELAPLFGDGGADAPSHAQTRVESDLIEFRHVRPFLDDQARFLAFGISVDYAGVMAASERIRTWSIVLAAVMSLVVLGATYLLSLLLIRPLTQITAAAHAHTRGIAHHPLPVHRGDEIGVLARAFRHMVDTLKNEEARIRAVVENSVDAIITIDRRGIVCSYNKASQTIFGYAAEEVIGQNVNMLMPSPTREEHDGYIERFLGGGEAKIVGIGREVTGRRKNGSAVPLYLSISQVELDGELFFTGILHDITVQKEAEAKLCEANKALEAANLELDSFVYSASHDIRAPLRSVIGLIDRSRKALARGDHEKLESRYLPLIVKNVEKLDRLVLDLLAISRADRVEHAVSEVDFDDLIEECLQQLDQMDSADEIQFSKHVNVDGPYHCELPRLQQVLSNLFSNSIKYRDASKPVCTLDVSVEASAGQGIRITVKDNGTGIQEKEHEDAFKMFSRATNASFGSGLGLYLVKKQVEKLNGVIDYTTSPAGTEFTIELPRLAGKDGEDGTA